MKKFTSKFIVLGFLALALFSCKKDEDATNKGGLSGNTLSGKIAGWTQGSDKKLISYTGTAEDMTGETTIGADGSFSLVMSAPETSTLDSIVSYFGMPLTISDPTTLCTDILFDICDNDYQSIGSMEFSNGIAELSLGYAIGDIMYVNRNTTIKGSYTFSFFGISETDIVDLNLKAGWNLLTAEVTKYSEHAGAITIETKISNSVPDNMNWKHVVEK